MPTPQTLRLLDTAHQVLRENDRVAHLQRFLEHGLTRDQVGHLRHLGAIARPRTGWYVDPTLPEDAFRAVCVGGVLACTSAAATWGIATPEGHDRTLQVALAPNASRLRRSRDPRSRARAGAERNVRWHWEATEDRPGGWRVGVVDAILQMARCVDYRWLVAAIDSARCGAHRAPVLDDAALARLGDLLPAHLKRAVDESDARAEASGETFIRLGLRERGIPVEPQVWLTSAYRTDLLVDGWLPIESDGMRFHAGEDAVERDRDRDADIATLGAPPLRFTQTQAVRETDRVVSTIEAVWRRARLAPRAVQEISGDTPRRRA